MELQRRSGDLRPPEPPPNPGPLLCSSVLRLLFGIYASSHFLACASADPDQYLLNCGSSSTLTIDDRTFEGDNVKTGHFNRNCSVVPIVNPSPTPGLSMLYTTASVFPSACTYEFGLSQEGAHFVRLHFSPFSDRGYNLSSYSASFQVTAMDDSIVLLTSKPSAAGITVVKEFLLWLPSDQFRITFTPNASISRAIAYVNAIEIFVAPERYMNSTKPIIIGSPGFSSIDLEKRALESVFRVNAGGAAVSYPDDMLHRTWVDGRNNYLVPEDASAAESVNSSLAIIYPTGADLTPNFAPEAVYTTAEQMKQGVQQANFSWDFSVSSGYTYLLRLHFCDFVSTTVDALYFNIYVNNQKALANLHPADRTGQRPRRPFYLDFAVDVVDSQSLRVGVGPSSKSNDSTRNAILNGLEIWKVSNSNGSFDSWAITPKDAGSRWAITPKEAGSRNKVVIIAVVSAVGALVAIVAGVFYFLTRRRKRKTAQLVPETQQLSRHRQGGSTPARPEGEGSESGITTTTHTTIPNSLVDANLNLLITLEELTAATNGFDEALVIGYGGFGKVYKGVLRDGTVVAVKRASVSSKQGLPEFENEITLLSRIRHRHLVSLVGFCNENDEMILAYEYMEKGSVKDLLYGPRSVSLSWKERLEICIGAAKGLHYLHTGFHHTIIHRDIKSSNILLGRNYVAKVCDFGLSKVNPSVDHAAHVSTAVKGSFGYMDPEYLKTQKLTDKSDVYSFGVVLFEILCGRPAIHHAAPLEQVNLAEWAAECKQRGVVEEIVDVRLKREIEPNSLRKFVETAAKCLADDGADRPGIADVLWNLQYAMQLQETGGVGQREPFEDSVNVDSQLPSFIASVRQQLLGSARFLSEDDDESEASSSNILLQSVTSSDR